MVTDMPTTCINPSGVQYLRDHLAQFPLPGQCAEHIISKWLLKRGITIAPDQLDVVTLHYQVGDDYGWTGVVAKQLSLVEAMMANWQTARNLDAVPHMLGALQPEGSSREIRLVEALRPPTDPGAVNYYTFSGIFRRSDPQVYTDKTHIEVPIEAFQTFVWNQDFHTLYKARLDKYWHEHFEGHRLSMKTTFIAACNKQVGEGSLSDAARKLAWQAAGLMPRKATVWVSPVNIYGYVASDMLYITDQALTLLYIPGNSSPLLEFDSEELMKDWFGEQCKTANKRQALKQHFRLDDGPQGVEFSGLDAALEGLGVYPQRHHLSPFRSGFTAEGFWPPREYVNYRSEKYSPALVGDPFQALAKRQYKRSYADADFIIKSDTMVIKARWQTYLNSALNLLTPLTFAVPGLAPLLAIGGAAQLGLALDQAINGKTLQDKTEGLESVAFGLFNAAPIVAKGVTKASALFRVKSNRFVLPSRVNDQIGYPLGPVVPPALEAELFFQVIPESTAPSEVGNPDISRLVRRHPRYNGQTDQLKASVELEPGQVQEVELAYDMEFDLFIRNDKLYYPDKDYYQALPSNTCLTRADPSSRIVTDQMRNASLLALGSEVSLPLELPSVSSGANPIPKRVSSLWIGDQVIEAKLAELIVANAKKLSNSSYQYRLFLSSQSPGAYVKNLMLLSHTPGLKILVLEEQAFFTAFQESPYFAQYQAALQGNGGVGRNFSSASDILRYPMLYHEGGLYMDVDDTLLEADQEATNCVGACSSATARIDEVDLHTTRDGLLLHPPMSNELLGMRCEYCTSMIGSHARNPTLTRISQEMHKRFLADPDFYHSKPNQDDDPAAFARYASRLNHLTGPKMFTEVIDQLLPELRNIRKIKSLQTLRLAKLAHFLNANQFNTLTDQLLPLQRIATVGGSQSWVKT